MKDRKLATRYARALLSVLTDPAQAESADRFLAGLKDAMRDSIEFRRLMLDPSFSATQRKKILQTLIQQAGLGPSMTNFLFTLVQNNRTSSIPSVAEVFHEEREKALGIVPAEITTATPMNDELTRRAGAALEGLTGRKVRLTCQVDPDLLGGAVTKIGSTIYDGSVRTQLTQLRRKMTQE